MANLTLQLADWQPIHGTKIDWGTLPAWLGSVLSGLSVLLALSIIVRDRQRAQRAQIDSVGVHAQISGNPLPDNTEVVVLDVYIHNASSTYIINPYLRYISEKDGGVAGGFSVHYIPERDASIPNVPGAPQLLPGEHCRLRADFGPVHVTDVKASLDIQDSHNRVWRRDLQTWNLKELRGRKKPKNAPLVV